MKQDTSVFCILLSAAICLLWPLHAGRASFPVFETDSSPGTTRSTSASAFVSIDPLTADVRTLRQLPGIGPKLARTMHHQSRVLQLESLHQLERIEGIGPTRAQSIRDAVRDFEDNHPDAR